jgi:riboflavin synthase
VFAVALIPHTLMITTLGNLRKGDAVNLEVDLIGKYVEKLLSAKPTKDNGSQQAVINKAYLAENGFLR